MSAVILFSIVYHLRPRVRCRWKMSTMDMPCGSEILCDEYCSTSYQGLFGYSDGMLSRRCRHEVMCEDRGMLSFLGVFVVCLRPVTACL